MDDSMVFARWRHCAFHLIHACSDPSESKCQTASRSVQPFSHSSRQTVAVLCNGPPPFPLKLPFPTGDLTTIHVPWAHPGPQPKPHLDRFSRFCKAHYCDRPPDRPTDHATRSVTIDCIGVCMRTVRQPNNTILLLLFAKVLEFSVSACYFDNA